MNMDLKYSTHWLNAREMSFARLQEEAERVRVGPQGLICDDYDALGCMLLVELVMLSTGVVVMEMVETLG